MQLVAPHIYDVHSLDCRARQEISLVTPTFDPAQSGSGSGGGMFRPGGHILIVPQGSAIAILDLERGVIYATTPLGAEAWGTLVEGARPPRPKMVEGQSEPADDEDHHEWARIAGYLLDRRIIEPAAD
jgi:hypothetical protein